MCALVFGDFYDGREEFDRRQDDVFRGIFKGTKLAPEIRKLRFIRPDVAVVDVVTTVAGALIRPSAVDVGADGTLRSSLLMLLEKEHAIGKSPLTITSGGRRDTDCPFGNWLLCTARVSLGCHAGSSKRRPTPWFLPRLPSTPITNCLRP
jgi:hypothetical protein